MKLEANALLWLLAHDALDIAAFTSRFQREFNATISEPGNLGNLKEKACAFWERLRLQSWHARRFVSALPS
jgi:hypothetical protein